MNIYIILIILFLISFGGYLYYKKEKFVSTPIINKYIKQEYKKPEHTRLEFNHEKYNRDYEDLTEAIDTFRSETDFNEDRLPVNETEMTNYDTNFVKTVIDRINTKTKNFDKNDGLNQPQTMELPYDKHLKALGVKLTNLYQKPVDNEKIKLVDIIHGLHEETEKEVRCTYNIIVKKKHSNKLCNLLISTVKNKPTNARRIEKIIINGYLEQDLSHHNNVKLSYMADTKEILNKFDKWQKARNKLIYN
jgi:hypothetical protein